MVVAQNSKQNRIDPAWGDSCIYMLSCRIYNLNIFRDDSQGPQLGLLLVAIPLAGPLGEELDCGHDKKTDILGQRGGDNIIACQRRRGISYP